MSVHTDFDIKERVRAASDIVDVVGGYLELRRQGSVYVTRCPWHDDNKPSLQVNPTRQTWKCWPCNIGGDVFSFVQQREGVDFLEALKILADRAGIAFTPSGGRRAEPGSPNDKSTLFAAMDWAASQFRSFLIDDTSAVDARRYLTAREVSDASQEKFLIGFAPDSWSWLSDQAKSSPYSSEVLEACGLLIQSDSGRRYGRYRGRIMFPIHDLQNRVVGFGGRILPSIAETQEQETGKTAAKYINSPETRLYSKSDNLYGLNLVRANFSTGGPLVVVEGYTDVIASWQAGLENVVAVLGTALNDRHMRLLKRFSDQVVLVLDGDTAGMKRASEILDLFVAAEVDLRIMTLPQGQDPADFLGEHGASGFRELLSRAPDALDHKIAIETSGVDLIRDTHRANTALENILQVLSKSPHRQSATRVRVEQLQTRLARLFGISLDEIRSRIKTISSKNRRPSRFDSPPGESDRPEIPPVAAIANLDHKERELLQLLSSEESFLDMIIEAISPQQFQPGLGREAFGLYCDCFNRGIEPELSQVLMLTEDVALKNLLVDLDEEEQEKRKSTEFEPQQRLADVLYAFELADIQVARQESRSRLANEDLSPSDETSTLLELLEKSRRRQGL